MMRKPILAGAAALALAGPVLAEPVAAAETKACPAGAVDIAPGASIQEAVRAGERGASFCIRAGVHRLQTVIPKAGQHFYGEPGSVLNGARVLTEFRREGRFWVADEQHQTAIEAGVCLPVERPCQVPAGFFIDDKPLRQVIRRDDVTPDSFFFDRKAARIYFAADPAGRRVEAAVTRFAFAGSAPDVQFHGLTVEKYDSPSQQGVIHGATARGWRIENSEIRLNSTVGAVVGSGGAIVGSRFHHNGQLGIGASGKDVLLEGNVIEDNNTLDFDPGWHAGGVKTTYLERATMRRNTVRRNNGPGLWCDIDCRDVLIEDNIVEDNADSGIFYEISYDARIIGNVVSRNGSRPNGWIWGAQIQIAASEGTQVSRNEVTVPPWGHAIILVDQGRAREGGGFYKTQRNVVRGNIVRFLGPGDTGGASDEDPGAENAGIIERGGNVFADNTYLIETATEPRFHWGYDDMSFAEFQRLGQDQGSTLRRPAASR